MLNWLLLGQLNHRSNRNVSTAQFSKFLILSAVQASTSEKKNNAETNTLNDGLASCSFKIEMRLELICRNLAKVANPCLSYRRQMVVYTTFGFVIFFSLEFHVVVFFFCMSRYNIIYKSIFIEHVILIDQFRMDESTWATMVDNSIILSEDFVYFFLILLLLLPCDVMFVRACKYCFFHRPTAVFQSMWTLVQMDSAWKCESMCIWFQLNWIMAMLFLLPNREKKNFRSSHGCYTTRTEPSPAMRL